MTAREFVSENIAKGNRISVMHKIVLFVRDSEGKLVDFVDLVNNEDINVFADLAIEVKSVNGKNYKSCVYRTQSKNPFEK